MNRMRTFAFAAAGIVMLAACGGDDAIGAAPTVGDEASSAPDTGESDAGTARDATLPPPPGDAGTNGDGAADATAKDTGPAPACAGKAAASGDTKITLKVGNLTRTAEVHVPIGYDPSRATPLVLAFHGFTDDGAGMRSDSHFDILGDQRGFLSVFPEGTNSSWNAGPCCGAAQLTGVDDVGFVNALVLQLTQTYCVDDAKIFAAGFSNGGFFAHRLGCEAAVTFAAIGVVSGQEGMSSCEPTRHVPVLQIHGTSDPIVPYDGDPLLGFPATKTTMDGWATRDTCALASTEVHRDGDTHCSTYNGCPSGVDVELCTVDGGGHDWPRGGSAWDGGAPPSGFVASTYMLDFFFAHPKP